MGGRAPVAHGGKTDGRGGIHGSRSWPLLHRTPLPCRAGRPSVCAGAGAACRGSARPRGPPQLCGQPGEGLWLAACCRWVVDWLHGGGLLLARAVPGLLAPRRSAQQRHSAAPHLPTLTPACPLQLDGIAAAEEQGDTTSMFGLAGLLLASALDADPSLLEEAASDEPGGSGAAAGSRESAPAYQEAFKPAAAEVAAVALASSGQQAAGAQLPPLEPTGQRSKYDPIAALLSWGASPSPAPAVPRHRQPRYDPAAALLAAATAAGAQRPTRPKYCAVKDVLAWLLDGWAANSERAEAGRPAAAYIG